MHNIRTFEDKHPTIGERVYIDPQATVIGDVKLGQDVSVWPTAVIRGDVNAISIGEACNIQDGAILHVTHDGPYTPGGEPLILGKGITVGHRAILHACHIEDYCLIGINTVVLDKVYVEHHVMIAAGSLIPPGKHLQSGYLYLGNPARAIRPLTEEELAHLEYSAQHYVRLKNKYL
ncbi:transferase [Legionella lansingensis]|uniref:Transferase n=1 Tax=Legionella lansingensis TaxID=45067 RepID=A0A0W0VPG6_9GAMM|nr:gamma carbonic anhydrase family protein [Legionella lansingensis]KTD21946.1 transferase [Legionella lansingensis]SNV46035.1 transferase [Legionella lansingensis]